jgi:hypothetical protein
MLFITSPFHGVVNTLALVYTPDSGLVRYPRPALEPQYIDLGMVSCMDNTNVRMPQSCVLSAPACRHSWQGFRGSFHAPSIQLPMSWVLVTYNFFRLMQKFMG